MNSEELKAKINQMERRILCLEAEAKNTEVTHDHGNAFFAALERKRRLEETARKQRLEETAGKSC